MATICTKPKQVKAWIDNNKMLWDFWSTVVANGTWGGLGKDRDQAIALQSYYEGQYDMACKFKCILEEV